MDNVYFYQVENQQEQDILNRQEDEFKRSFNLFNKRFRKKMS